MFGTSWKQRVLITLGGFVLVTAEVLSFAGPPSDANGGDSGVSKQSAADEKSAGESSGTSTADGESGERVDPSGSTLEKSPSYWSEQLGHDRFLRRELATRRLIEAGPDAVAPLMQVIATGNLEINQRAVLILSELALKQDHTDDGGAHEALRGLAVKSIGSRKSMVDRALVDLSKKRAAQARDALTTEGFKIGYGQYTFNLGTLIRPVTMLRVGLGWKDNAESVTWARWLRAVPYAEIQGDAICKEVLGEVSKMPDLSGLTLLEGEIDVETIDAMQDLRQINQIEFRYVPLTDEHLNAIARLPIRIELSLMGTGVTEEQAFLLQRRMPGLLIHQHSGAFLGIKCDIGGPCIISEVIRNSAAAKSGLQPNDTIIQLDDVPVDRFEDLRQKIRTHSALDKVAVKYIRAGREFDTTVVLRKYVAP